MARTARQSASMASSTLNHIKISRAQTVQSVWDVFRHHDSSTEIIVYGKCIPTATHFLYQCALMIYSPPPTPAPTTHHFTHTSTTPSQHHSCFFRTRHDFQSLSTCGAGLAGRQRVNCGDRSVKLSTIHFRRHRNHDQHGDAASRCNTTRAYGRIDLSYGYGWFRGGFRGG